MKWKRWLLGLIPLIAVVITIVVLSRSTKELTQPTDVSAALSSAEGAYFMESVQSQSFDKQGNIHSVLNSPRVDHFPDEHRSTIHAPHIQFYRDAGSPWHLTAETGNAIHPSQEMLLTGNVQLRREADENNAPVQMLTETLVINGLTREASSENEVRFVTAQGNIKGIGLRADLAKEQLQLLSHVEGEYVPNHP